MKRKWGKSIRQKARQVQRKRIWTWWVGPELSEGLEYGLHFAGDGENISWYNCVYIVVYEGPGREHHLIRTLRMTPCAQPTDQ